STSDRDQRIQPVGLCLYSTRHRESWNGSSHGVGDWDGMAPVARRCQCRKDPRSQNRSDGAPTGGVVGLGSLGEFELAIRVFAKNKFKKESPGHPAYLSLLRGNLTADDNLIPMRPSSGDRNEVVFAGAMKLEYEKHRRVRADVCYKMRTTRPHGVGLTRGEAYLLLGLLKEDSQAPLKDEERVLHARVIVPRH